MTPTVTTGNVKWVRDMTTGHHSQAPEAEGGEDSPPMLMQRDEYTVRAVDAGTGGEHWNLTVAVS